MAGLSVATNTFSIFGLADVVFRSIIQLCALIKQASSALESAAELLAAVQSLTTVVIKVRDWAAEFEQSVFAQEDGQLVSRNIANALAACEKQIAGLARRLETVRNAKNDWVQWVRRGVAFALSEAQIRHSVQMMMYHQNTLNSLLLVRAGHDAIILRREIRHINTNL